MISLKNIKSLRLFDSIRLHGCHTQAALSCLKYNHSGFISTLFEAFTTVPFGIKHVCHNPNRTIDCIMDPDEGLNFALSLLGFEIVYLFSEKTNRSSPSIEKLNNLLKSAPVLLGPLDMGELSFYEDRYLFKGIDHYVVALGLGKNLKEIVLLDPERIGVVTTELDDFIPSWQAKGLIEGRGGYTMRQVKGSTFLDHKLMQRMAVRVVYKAIKNIQAMEKDHMENLLLLSQEEIDRLKSPSLWSGMMFCLKTQVRRTICAYCFLSKYFNQTITKTSLIKLLQYKLLTIEALTDKMATCTTVVPKEIKQLAQLELKVGNALRELSW